jgi:hypothetical protein
MAMLKVCMFDSRPLIPGCPASSNRRLVTMLKSPPPVAGAISVALFQVT